ncbi:MAG TPA: nucleotidyltransferase family protein [Candidatus Omnitrophota bacterium]|nr:nucleotidyltransferase family protein [Candidatus Omnitrophota bacterium]
MRNIAPKRKAKALILAAGYATRLYPLTLNIPKPLLKITNTRTVIDFIVDDLLHSGLTNEIIVVTNHKFYGDFCKWKKERSKDNISVLDDGTLSNDDRLGAVGDINYAVKKRTIKDDLIVVGGDNLFDRGFSKFLRFALKKSPYASLGLFDIKDKREASSFGVVSIDAENRVVSFEEKPARPKSTCVATCMYYFPKETLSLLNKYMNDPETKKDAPGNYIRWLMQNDKVFGDVIEDGRWHDIGHFDSYKEVVIQYRNRN